MEILDFNGNTETTHSIYFLYPGQTKYIGLIYTYLILAMFLQKSAPDPWKCPQ